jgi:hypothetical protein
MSIMKRYTIFNFYCRAGNQSPQSCHALNNLWKQVDSSKDEVAVASFKDWAYNHETEIMLMGGDHEAMESLYLALSNISGVLSSKFNEPGMRDTCAVVSFVASVRIVAGVNYVRNNRLNPANAQAELVKTKFVDFNDTIVLSKLNDGEEVSTSFNLLTQNEIFVISQVAFLPLS